MLEYGLAQLLAPKHQPKKKPPGLVKENKVNKQKVPVSKVIGRKRMEQKTGDSHDNNYALVNLKSDKSSWTNNLNEKDNSGGSQFSWSWTDLLEIVIIIILIFFIYHFVKKKMNKSREKKITKTTRNLVAEMKARDSAAINMPSAPAFVPFQSQTMMVPVNKSASGSRSVTNMSNMDEPP